MKESPIHDIAKLELVDTLFSVDGQICWIRQTGKGDIELTMSERLKFT